MIAKVSRFSHDGDEDFSYDGPAKQEFADVFSVTADEVYLTIVRNVDGLTVETLIPNRDVNEVEIHHEKDVITEVEEARERMLAASRAANSPLTLA